MCERNLPERIAVSMSLALISIGDQVGLAGRAGAAGADFFALLNVQNNASHGLRAFNFRGAGKNGSGASS
jgi:hypothetical protein